MNIYNSLKITKDNTMQFFNNFNEMYSSNTNKILSVFNYESNYNCTYWAGTESFEKSCITNLVDYFGDLVDYYNKTNNGVYNGEYEDIFDEWRILGNSDVIYDYVMGWETNMLESCEDIINDLGDGEKADDYEGDASAIYRRADSLLEDYWDRNRDSIFEKAERVVGEKYPEIYYGN